MSDAQGQRVYVVAQFHAETTHGNVWDLQGIFTDEARAVLACRKENYGYFSVMMNEELPETTVIPWDFLYPLTYNRAESKEDSNGTH